MRSWPTIATFLKCVSQCRRQTTHLGNSQRFGKITSDKSFSKTHRKDGWEGKMVGRGYFRRLDLATLRASFGDNSTTLPRRQM